MEKAFQTFLTSNKIYYPKDIKDVIEKVKPYFRMAYTNTKTKYYNIPCSFDIETSSFYQDGEKVAIMYIWMLGIYGCVIVGRTWDEYIETIETIVDELGLDVNKRLIIYVHSLAYEFQFTRKHFEWYKVFCIDNRKPIYAITANGIEFRCSYLLSGYSLQKIGDDLTGYELKKLVGNLDYEKIRHSKTVITPDEMNYCVNDVKIVMAYIYDKIEQEGNISRIPITKTGYVRNYCRNRCFYEPGVSRKKSFKRSRYMELMKSLRLSPDEYQQLKRAFQGGFTHANPFCTNKIIHDVTSFDFTSSYPCVMLAEQFPMSSSEKIEIKTKDEFYRNLKLYCCLFDVEFVGLESKEYYESYISISRCWGTKCPIVNNGRVVSAERICTTLTEQDFMIIQKMYTWKHLKIRDFRRYRKGYLPTDFVKSILKLYQDKTTLKGVEGKEVEYMNSKEMLNSCYGMAVTDIVRPEIIYINDWLPPETPDIEKVISKYNNSPSRFLFYPWGVWVTAYARRNLFTGICEFKYDYVYSDTDSIKVVNADKHLDYINKYNDVIQKMLTKAMKYHGLSPDVIKPKTIKGVEKPLGVWDFDGHYSDFKTLGAKRYMVKYSDDNRNPESVKGKYNITVSGLNKSKCVPYLLEKYGEQGIFEVFNDELYIPPEYTGKNTHTYIDTPKSGIIIDYTGVRGTYEELSAVHLEPTDYSLKMSREYLDYLLSIETIEL